MRHQKIGLHIYPPSLADVANFINLVNDNQSMFTPMPDHRLAKRVVEMVDVMYSFSGDWTWQDSPKGSPMKRDNYLKRRWWKGMRKEFDLEVDAQIVMPRRKGVAIDFYEHLFESKHPSRKTRIVILDNDARPMRPLQDWNTVLVENQGVTFASRRYIIGNSVEDRQFSITPYLGEKNYGRSE